VSVFPTNDVHDITFEDGEKRIPAADL